MCYIEGAGGDRHRERFDERFQESRCTPYLPAHIIRTRSIHVIHIVVTLGMYFGMHFEPPTLVLTLSEPHQALPFSLPPLYAISDIAPFRYRASLVQTLSDIIESTTYMHPPSPIIYSRLYSGSAHPTLSDADAGVGSRVKLGRCDGDARSVG